MYILRLKCLTGIRPVNSTSATLHEQTLESYGLNTHRD